MQPDRGLVATAWDGERFGPAESLHRTAGNPLTDDTGLVDEILPRRRVADPRQEEPTRQILGGVGCDAHRDIHASICHGHPRRVDTNGAGWRGVRRRPYTAPGDKSEYYARPNGE